MIVVCYVDDVGMAWDINSYAWVQQVGTARPKLVTIQRTTYYPLNSVNAVNQLVFSSYYQVLVEVG